MLKIEDLHASVEDKGILKGINIEVKAGEVHAIMGPNGSGKSTLASVIAGKEEYEVEKGHIFLEGKDIEELDAEEVPIPTHRTLCVEMQTNDNWCHSEQPS